MKKLLLFAVTFAAFAMVPMLAAAQARDVGASLFYDVSEKAMYPVLITKIGTVQKALGTKIDLDFNAFAGVNPKSRPVGGFAVTYSASIAQNVQATLGPALIFQDGKVRGSGVFLGVLARF